MSLRPTVVALVLVVGSTAAATAQSDEYAFRRFRVRPTPHLRFSFDDSFRMTDRVDRYRKLALDRSHQMAERIRDRAHQMAERVRNRELAKWGREFDIRNRAFDRIDRARLREFEHKFRGMDRFGDRFERFKLDPPIRIKRHSRII